MNFARKSLKMMSHITLERWCFVTAHTAESGRKPGSFKSLIADTSDQNIEGLGMPPRPFQADPLPIKRRPDHVLGKAAVAAPVMRHSTPPPFHCTSVPPRFQPRARSP